MAGARPAAGKALAAMLVTGAAVIVCVMMAGWQWQRAHRTVDDAVPPGAPVPLSALDPQRAFAGMRVQLVGTFDPDHQLLVGPRPMPRAEPAAGRPSGAWVLTPLLPAEGGPAVAVVRGWIPADEVAGDPPQGTVSLDGVLVADEAHTVVAAGAAAAPPASSTPAGQQGMLTAVDSGALAALAGYRIRSGWFAAIPAEGSAQAAGQEQAGWPQPLTVTDLPGADVGLNLRNAAYSLQWLVFAGFVVIFAVRYTRQRPLALDQEIDA